MLYAILCYNSEDAVGSWSMEYHDETMARLSVVQDRLAKQGRLGPVARLLPTTAATTLRKGREELVIDRDQNHQTTGAFADIPGCFAQGASTAVDCNAFSACLALNLDFSMAFQLKAHRRYFTPSSPAIAKWRRTRSLLLVPSK